MGAGAMRMTFGLRSSQTMPRARSAPWTSESSRLLMTSESWAPCLWASVGVMMSTLSPHSSTTRARRYSVSRRDLARRRGMVASS